LVGAKAVYLETKAEAQSSWSIFLLAKILAKKLTRLVFIFERRSDNGNLTTPP